MGQPWDQSARWGGSIDVAGANTLTYSGIAAGTGTLTKLDTGTVILGGVDTYSAPPPSAAAR